MQTAQSLDITRVHGVDGLVEPRVRLNAATASASSTRCFSCAQLSKPYSRAMTSCASASGVAASSTASGGCL